MPKSCLRFISVRPAPPSPTKGISSSLQGDGSAASSSAGEQAGRLADGEASQAQSGATANAPHSVGVAGEGVAGLPGVRVPGPHCL